MIFGRVCVICDDFSDYHDKIIITSIDFIGRRPICGHYLQGEGSFWEPLMKTTTPSHRSHRRWSQRENQILNVINMHSMLYPMMQSSIFFQRFRCVLDWFRSVGSCGMSNVFGVGRRIWYNDCSLISTFDGSHWEEDDGRIRIEYYVFCISDFFMCNLGMYFIKI